MDIRWVHEFVSIDKVSLPRMHWKAKSAFFVRKEERANCNDNAEDGSEPDDGETEHPQRYAIKKLVIGSQQDEVLQYKV